MSKERQRTVLIALDESPGSQYAFKYALEQIVVPRDKLILVNVCPEVDVDVFYGSPEYLQQMEQGLKEASETLLAKYSNSAASHYSMEVECCSAVGDARKCIMEVAEKVNADVVIIGSRGLGTVSRMLLGSVSEYIVTHSSCPVLVVPPQKGAPGNPASSGILSAVTGFDRVGRIVESGM